MTTRDTRPIGRNGHRALDEPVSDDAWARFVINFATRGPANGEEISPLVRAIIAEACAWSDKRRLKLDRAGTQLVRESAAPRRKARTRQKIDNP